MLFEIQVHIFGTRMDRVFCLVGFIYDHVSKPTELRCLDPVHEVVGSVILDSEVLVHPTQSLVCDVPWFQGFQLSLLDL